MGQNRLVWRWLRNHLICLALLSTAPFQSAAWSEPSPNPQNKSTFIFYLENDIFAGTDKNYTNAVKFSWISRHLEKVEGGRGLANWSQWFIDHTTAVDHDEYMHNLALSFGQNIYTPRDTFVPTLIEYDQPYAGWTYLSAALHSQNFKLLNSLELSLGIIGPASLAEETQKIVHEWINSDELQGWDNQLSNEPGLMLTWQRFWRVLREPLGKGFAYDAIPHAGVTLGNVFTYANLGGELRFGYNLPADFGTSLIRPGGGTASPVSIGDPRLESFSKFGFSLFAGLDGRAIARNIFLDGNTWKESHSVDKNHFVADIASGVSVVYKPVKLTYTHVYRTKEFKDQDGGQFFGSLSISLTF
jgi:hypothetical protein